MYKRCNRHRISCANLPHAGCPILRKNYRCAADISNDWKLSWKRRKITRKSVANSDQVRATANNCRNCPLESSQPHSRRLFFLFFFFSKHHPLFTLIFIQWRINISEPCYCYWSALSDGEKKYHPVFLRYVSISETVNMSSSRAHPQPSRVGLNRQQKVFEIFTSSSLLGPD